MRYISFGWTTPAILDKKKTCTRRDWDEGYARKFKAGELVAAYDRTPRVGGHQIAVLRLTRAPYYEWAWDMPDSDWEAEGFEYLASIGAKCNGFTPAQLWAQTRAHPEHLWVIRFEVLELTKRIEKGEI